MTAGVRQRLEDITTIPGILRSQKGLPGGYTVARERDEESGALYVGVLAVTLCQQGGAQAIPFYHALGCVRVLVSFNMMAQYRSHTPDTIAYMEDYLDQFRRMKDIFLELRVTKGTQAKVDKQRKRSDVREP